ncbi:hypothetical protein MTX20_08695 [Bradyrhizobium sp. ISRA435]|nr:hypothetical protein MTX20_08695 [Bradyrhizobium sp. ISRA435]
MIDLKLSVASISSASRSLARTSKQFHLVSHHDFSRYGAAKSGRRLETQPAADNGRRALQVRNLQSLMCKSKGCARCDKCPLSLPTLAASVLLWGVREIARARRLNQRRPRDHTPLGRR